MRENQRFPALDRLRGIAALLVVLHHLLIYFDHPLNSVSFGWLNDHMYLMVDCFFMMSGFVIAHSFDAKWAEGLTFRRFLVLRAIRLYPMIALGIALGGAALLAYGRANPAISAASLGAAISLNFLLLPTTALLAYKPWLFPTNSSFWSLSFEMALYGAYAGVFRRFSLWQMRVALAISAALLGCAAFSEGGLDIGYRTGAFAIGGLRVLWPFLIGMFIRRSAPTTPFSTRWAWLATPLLLIVAANPAAIGGAYDAFADLLALPLVVWLAAASPAPATAVKVDLWLGALSYPLYAIHFPLVIAAASLTRSALPGPIIQLAVATLCGVVTIGLASFLSRYYDSPSRAALTRLLVSPDAPDTRKGAALFPGSRSATLKMKT